MNHRRYIPILIIQVKIFIVLKPMILNIIQRCTFKIPSTQGSRPQPRSPPPPQTSRNRHKNTSYNKWYRRNILRCRLFQVCGEDSGPGIINRSLKMIRVIFNMKTQRLSSLEVRQWWRANHVLKHQNLRFSEVTPPTIKWHVPLVSAIFNLGSSNASLRISQFQIEQHLHIITI